jgi:hypothetical protein
MCWGRASWWQEYVVEEFLHLTADIKQIEWEMESTPWLNVPKDLPPPSDFLPSTRFHLLKYTEPPKIVPPGRAYGGHFVFKS